MSRMRCIQCLKPSCRAWVILNEQSLQELQVSKRLFCPKCCTPSQVSDLPGWFRQLEVSDDDIGRGFIEV
jgi:hypothetical protein